MRKQSTILILSATLAISYNVNASKIISPVSVIDAPPHLISGFSYDRTIDQSGLAINFVSGTTDFDTFIGNKPSHTGSGLAQTYASSSHLPKIHSLMSIMILALPIRLSNWHFGITPLIVQPV